MKPPVLETPGLFMRPLTADDGPTMTALLTDPAFGPKLLDVPFPYPRKDVGGWIARHEEVDERFPDYAWGIARKPGYDLIGAIRLLVEPQDQRGEIEHWVGAPWWDSEIATQAVQEVTHYGFATLGLQRIGATARPENASSHQTLTNAGMRHEGLMRSFIFRDGQFIDADWFSVLQDEWDKPRTDE